MLDPKFVRAAWNQGWPPAKAGGRRMRTSDAGASGAPAKVYGLTKVNVPPNAWMPLPLPAVPVVTSPVSPTSGCSWL